MTILFIRRGVEDRSREVMIELFKMLVCLQQENCEEFWWPHSWEDVIFPEGMQRRFTRRLPGLQSFCSEDSLVRLGLLSLTQ